ncbi:hypothetical protein O181_013227 [Austropuccinia psidii MF-1]|uniref:Uncharacterized protein n=1 Tax=Austropuccinia psidii MF-1 TaxID=1389203 RepID=A0A9Q3BXW7_9BASI|nr:hypothetical protein [Austropuccinia psidii MF-1]
MQLRFSQGPFASNGAVVSPHLLLAFKMCHAQTLKPMIVSCMNGIAQPIVLANSNFPEGVASLNQVLCVTFNSEMSVNESPSLLDGRLPQENWAISHFIDASIPHNFSLCLGIIPSGTTAKDSFEAIKVQCCIGSCFQKSKVVWDLIHVLVDNSSGNPNPKGKIILYLQCIFAMFKKLGIEVEKLKGLFAQALCHAPPTLDQLITTAILSAFVGQVIINASQQGDYQACEPSPFVYCVSEPPSLIRPHSP